MPILPVTTSITVAYTTKNGNVSYEPSLTLSPVGENWVLDDCNDPIVGWYHDGKEKRDGQYLQALER